MTPAQRKANAEAELAKGLADISESHDKPGRKVDDGNVTSLFKQEDPDFMKKLRTGAEKIARIKGERKELSASIAEVMASFANEGLKPKAIKAAIQVDEMDPDDRRIYDITYNLMRKALGNPVQGDLFEASVASELRDRRAKEGQAKKPD